MLIKFSWVEHFDAATPGSIPSNRKNKDGLNIDNIKVRKKILRPKRKKFLLANIIVVN